MGSDVLSLFLPVAIALVMFGLGLTLTVADFTRVLRFPRAAVLALTCQIVVIPAICLGLVALSGVRGLPAVGVMLLVASPGGSLATLFSHLAGGDVALNITLTAVNSVLAVVTLPFVTGLAVALFLDDPTTIGLRPAQFAQVFALVLIPVVLGMGLRHRNPAWADRRRGAVRTGSVAVLALVIVAAIVTQFPTLASGIGTLGPLVLLLVVISLGVGYLGPRLLRVNREQSISSAMETGLHNGTLAIAIAVSVLGNETVAVPAILYSALMPFPAAVAAYLLSRRRRPVPAAA